MTKNKPKPRRRTKPDDAGQQQYHPLDLPIPGYGKRKMTHADFARVCRREGITVERRRLTGVRGFYMRANGQPFIAIASRLKGAARLQVEFHELGHYFLHTGKSMMRLSDMSDPTVEYTAAQKWAEIEADIVSYIALAPNFDLALLLQRLLPNVARRTWKGGAT